ncbi:MAG: hypothetical protein WBD31_00390 [Rubripirellula sp.]
MRSANRDHSMQITSTEEDQHSNTIRAVVQSHNGRDDRVAAMWFPFQNALPATSVHRLVLPFVG